MNEKFYRLNREPEKIILENDSSLAHEYMLKLKQLFHFKKKE